MLAMGAPAALILLVMVLLQLPESPRWGSQSTTLHVRHSFRCLGRFLLIMKRRSECIQVGGLDCHCLADQQVGQVLERVAQLNGTSLPDTELMDVPPHPTVSKLGHD